MKDRGFIISNLLNVLLMVVIALGVTFNHLILAIIIAIVAVINAGYLIYKSNEINKRNKGKANGKKS
ncbi:hypothetical protein ACUXOR_000059 [Staphylococcus pasteuri]|uniref:Uncharacterized protein n=2 Tax=Staphylococcus TaxID=1279 RepID=A0ABY1H457_9STAP|nr:MULTISPECIES: hypothetical protein [Staphylococcus]ATH63616.1 hypothetical protein BJG87_11860 [Staphylococcus pasteuri]KKI55776.1 hypothetical protein UF70_2215 [Staphylococcus pasteuri]MCF7599605.1 hypothetical protein [Staphylococcus pasteuri]MDI3232058.1 hypothetical protein [Staphylococcus pasteuri]MDO6573669.1 hypothetical protein [Staphylococcus pasteuri_A]